MIASSITSAVPAATPQQEPSVLAVLVVRDAAHRLRDVLAALAAQTHPRLGVLAVDDGSADDSHDILVQALGEGRITRHARPEGLARSLEEVCRLPVAAGAEYLLLLRDDVTLDPDAVARLVEAAHLRGVEGVGIVGAKVVDQERPRVLLDVGRSADRFGHPFSALQPGEIDQGQFDRVLEVMCVSSSAMLITREAWQRIGLFDERLGDDHGDLDLCWRARIAGFRVLMTPLARARRPIGGARPASGIGRSARHVEDRAALAVVLKNYGLLSLVWILPLGLALAIVRLLLLTLSRRFEEAVDVVAAIGWNVVHAPGTFRRRWRVQRARRVRDGALHRFMTSAGLRLPRWFQTAERILEEQHELDLEDEGQPAVRRLRHRTASLVGEHPVIVAAFVTLVVGAIVLRDLFGTQPLAGGALPSFPATSSGLLAELVSGYRTTGLGGTLAASPGLGAFSGLSWLLFGSTALAQKLALVGLPLLAAILTYRACVRSGARPGPAVVAAAAYGLSGVALWALSDGRLDLMVALAVLPPLIERFEVAFGNDEPADGRWRTVAGWGVTIAAGVAFWPGLAPALGVALAVYLGLGRSRGRGSMLAAGAALGAAVLLFPFVPTLLAGGGDGLGSSLGPTDPWEIGRLALGPGPGTWEVAWFLPIAAALGLSLAGSALRGPAGRAATLAVVGLGLAWASAAGWLPGGLANAPAYAGLAAAAMAIIVAIGLTSATGGLAREAFGFRQIGTALLAIVLTAGISLQAIASMVGERAVGGSDRIPAAWAVVDDNARGSFNVLWIGPDDGLAFPPPGGDPAGVVEAGTSTVGYGLTARDGVSVLDVGRPLVGPGADHLHDALGQILAGGTVHAGALLAPFAVRFLVARAGELPAPVLTTLNEQVDLVEMRTAGLTIFRNVAVLPPAFTTRTDGRSRSLIAASDPSSAQRLGDLAAVPLAPVLGGWEGQDGTGDLAIVGTETGPGWSLEGANAEPGTAFGWALSFPTSGQAVHIRFGAQLSRTLQSWLLAGLWLAALWFTRRPVAR
jgi:GT2 family glycosyltransferase